MSDYLTDSEIDSDFFLDEEDIDNVIQIDVQNNIITKDLSKPYIKDLLSTDKPRNIDSKTSSIYDLVNKETHNKNFNDSRTYFIVGTQRKTINSNSKRSWDSSPYKKVESHLRNLDIGIEFNDQDAFLIEHKQFIRVLGDIDVGCIEHKGFASISSYNSPNIYFNADLYFTKMINLNPGNPVKITDANSIKSKSGKVISNVNGVLTISVGDVNIEYNVNSISDYSYIVFPIDDELAPFSKKHLLNKNIIIECTSETDHIAKGLLYISGDTYLKIQKSSGHPLHNIIDISDLPQYTKDAITMYSEGFQKYRDKSKPSKSKKYKTPKYINEEKTVKDIEKNALLKDKNAAEVVKDIAVPQSMKSNIDLNTIVLNHKDLTKQRNKLIIPRHVYSHKNKNYMSNYAVYKMNYDSQKRDWIPVENITNEALLAKHKPTSTFVYNAEYFNNIKMYIPHKDNRNHYTITSYGVTYSVPYTDHEKIFLGSKQETDVIEHEIPEQGVLMVEMFDDADDDNNGENNVVHDNIIDNIFDAFKISLGAQTKTSIRERILTTRYRKNGENKIEDNICATIGYVIVMGQVSYPKSITKCATVDQIMRVRLNNTINELVFLESWYNTVQEMVGEPLRINVSKFIDNIERMYKLILSEDLSFNQIVKEKKLIYSDENKREIDTSLWSGYRPSEDFILRTKDIKSNNTAVYKGVISSKNKDGTNRTDVAPVYFEKREDMQNVDESTESLYDKLIEYALSDTLIKKYTGRMNASVYKSMSKEIDDDRDMSKEVRAMIYKLDIELLLKLIYILKSKAEYRGVLDGHMVPKIYTWNVLNKQDSMVLRYYVYTLLRFIRVKSGDIYKNLLNDLYFSKEIWEKNIATAREKYEIIREEDKLSLQKKWKDMSPAMRRLAQEMKAQKLDYDVYLNKPREIDEQHDIVDIDEDDT